MSAEFPSADTAIVMFRAPLTVPAKMAKVRSWAAIPL